jgi:hypothetical protein
MSWLDYLNETDRSYLNKLKPQEMAQIIHEALMPKLAMLPGVKGALLENYISSLIDSIKYQVQNVTKRPHSADLKVSNGIKVVYVEIKNYNYNVPQAELDKFYRDIDLKANINGALFVGTPYNKYVEHNGTHIFFLKDGTLINEVLDILFNLNITATKADIAKIIESMDDVVELITVVDSMRENFLRDSDKIRSKLLIFRERCKAITLKAENVSIDEIKNKLQTWDNHLTKNPDLYKFIMNLLSKSNKSISLSGDGKYINFGDITVKLMATKTKIILPIAYVNINKLTDYSLNDRKVSFDLDSSKFDVIYHNEIYGENKVPQNSKNVDNTFNNENRPSKKETEISSQHFEQNTNIQQLEKLPHQTGKSHITLPNKNKITYSPNTNFKTSLVDKAMTPQQKLPVAENNEITSPTKKEKVVSIPGSEQNTKHRTPKNLPKTNNLLINRSKISDGKYTINKNSNADSLNKAPRQITAQSESPVLNTTSSSKGELEVLRENFKHNIAKQPTRNLPRLTGYSHIDRPNKNNITFETNVDSNTSPIDKTTQTPAQPKLQVAANDNTIISTKQHGDKPNCKTDDTLVNFSSIILPENINIKIYSKDLLYPNHIALPASSLKIKSIDKEKLIKKISASIKRREESPKFLYKPLIGGGQDDTLVREIELMKKNLEYINNITVCT